MTISTSTLWEIRSTATASNVNGGGFNPTNANFLTNGAATSATGNSPVFTSASYNFVAGDVGAWIYIKSGTNWLPGWYKIVSVASNAATLSAAIGAAVNLDAANRLMVASTVAGCATTASPTSATWGIDYSQQDAAGQAYTDLASTIGTTNPATITSAAHPFGVHMVGNIIHVTAGTSWTVGWYEIVSVSGSTATVDRAIGSIASLSSGTGKLGGGLSLGSSDDAVFELTGNYFVKGGSSITYTLGGTVSQSAAGTSIEGYNVLRGDRPTGNVVPASDVRPKFDQGAVALTWGASTNVFSLQSTSSVAGNAWILGASCIIKDCKVTNTSTTAAETAISSGANCQIISCELKSIRGNGLKLSTTNFVSDCYIHDCDKGIVFAGAVAGCFLGNIIANCVTSSIDASTSASLPLEILNNTFYGAENKLGIGLKITAANGTKNIVMNNIFYGFVTGISNIALGTNAASEFVDDYNCFFNNTADLGGAGAWSKGINDIAVNPSFTSVTQRTGSTATTTSGNHLVQTGATFQTWGVVAGNVVQIVSGTGPTAGLYDIASVDSETQITVTQTLTANATGDKVWQITQGHNFAPTGAV